MRKKKERGEQGGEQGREEERRASGGRTETLCPTLHAIAPLRCNGGSEDECVAPSVRGGGGGTSSARPAVLTGAQRSRRRTRRRGSRSVSQPSSSSSVASGHLTPPPHPPNAGLFSLSQSHFHLLSPFLSACTSCHVPVPPSRCLCASDGDKLTKAPPLGLASEPSHAAGMPGIPRSRLACFHMTPRKQRMISIQSPSFLFFLPHAAFVTLWLRLLIILIFFLFSLSLSLCSLYP